VDEKKWERHRAVVIFGVAIFLLGVPSALSFNVMADVHFFGMTFFDVVDHLASNILLPLGGLLIAVFVAWFWTTSEVFRNIREGAEQLFDGYPAFGPVWMVFLRYVAPLLIALVFLNSLGLF
jgi:NSS family neurotransmitter:Na+ symporter